MGKITAVYTPRVRAITSQLTQLDTAEEVQAVSEALTAQFKRVSALRAAQFKPGNRVVFHAGKRGYKSGVVQSVGGTSLKIDVSGLVWTVDASLLELVPEKAGA